MVKIKLPKIERATRRKIILVALFVIGVLTMITFFAVRVALWFDSNKLTFNSPLVVKTQKVVVVTKREAILPVGITDDFLFRENVEMEADIYNFIQSSANPEIAMLIAGVFQEEPMEWIAIFTAESGLNKDAINYNCIYVEDGESESRSCNKGDEANAWSVDCGVAQLNFSGKTCPDSAFDPIWNILSARKKYEVQGKEAWVAFTTKTHLPYLAKY